MVLYIAMPIKTFMITLINTTFVKNFPAYGSCRENVSSSHVVY